MATKKIKKTTTKKNKKSTKKYSKKTVRKTLPKEILTPEIIEKVGKSTTALSTIDPVSQYLAEIRKYPLLTKEQEQEWAIKYRDSKDPKAAEMLVTSNLRFVVKVAAEYSRFGAKMIDLIQEGNVGLMHAVREFNPYKGVRLITYAVWWIRGYIQDYMMKQYSLVKIGTTQNQRKLFYQLQKQRRELESLGYEAGVKQLSGKLGIPEDEVKTMTQRMSGRDISLDAPVSDDDSKSSLIDLQKNQFDVGVDDEMGLQQEIHILHENIDKIRPQLNEREIYLLENRLLSDSPLTLQQIGNKYSITREAVRQMENRLIQKIKTQLKNKIN